MRGGRRSCGGCSILVGKMWLAPEFDPVWGLRVLLVLLGSEGERGHWSDHGGWSRASGFAAGGSGGKLDGESNRGAGLDLQRTLVPETCRREKKTLKKGVFSSSKQQSDFLCTVVAGGLERFALLAAVELCSTSLSAFWDFCFASGSGADSALLKRVYFCTSAAFSVGVCSWYRGARALFCTEEWRRTV